MNKVGTAPLNRGATGWLPTAMALDPPFTRSTILTVPEALFATMAWAGWVIEVV